MADPDNSLGNFACERVMKTAGGQSSCSAKLPNTTANRWRSRVKDLSNGKCQTQKRLQSLGLAYVSRSGMMQRQKMIKPGCGLKCRQKCHDRTSPEEREQSFSSFWQLENLHLQRQFLINYVKIIRKNRSQKGKKSRYSSCWRSWHASLPNVFFAHTFH